MVTLNMWIWGAEPLARQFIDREIKAFNRKFPDLEIIPTLIHWRDAWEKIIISANEKKGPDILQIGSTWNGTLADLEVLKDITDEFYNAGLGGEIFAPAAWTSCRFPKSERISSLPWFTDIRAIYYRKDIFGTLNISTNALDTWESFEKTCGKLKGFKNENKEIEVLGVSGQGDALLLHNIAPWIWSAGGDFLTLDGKQAAFNSKEALNGIEFYIKLISNGYISSSALKVKTEQIAIDFFIHGDYTMCIPGPLANDPTYDTDIVRNSVPSLFPGGPGGRYVFAGGSNLAITSFSQHPKEAWEFIKFLTSYESQNAYPIMLNMFPSLLESFSAVFIEDLPNLQGLKESWRYGRAFPNVPAWGAIESLLIECFGNIFARVKEGVYNMSLVRQDLDRAALEVDDLLAR